MQELLVPATNVPLGGKTSSLKNNKWAFCTSIPSSYSSDATASL
jgi:hypothetical protein